MNKELKTEIEKSNQYSKHWVEEALNFIDDQGIDNKPVRRCCENALNGVARINDLLKEELK